MFFPLVRQPSVIESPRNRRSTPPLLAWATNPSWRATQLVGVLRVAGMEGAFFGFAVCANRSVASAKIAQQVMKTALFIWPGGYQQRVYKQSAPLMRRIGPIGLAQVRLKPSVAAG